MKQILLQVLYKFLALCAKVYVWRHKIYVIGITGSVGKTSCRMVLSGVLQQIVPHRDIYTSPKNYNSELGLVFSLFQIEEYNPSIQSLLKLTFTIFRKTLIGKKNTDILVAEYGIDAPGDMDHLISAMKPDIAILTKLDSVHSANFPGGVEQYWQEKWKLLLAASRSYVLDMDEFSRKQSSLLENIINFSSYRAGAPQYGLDEKHQPYLEGEYEGSRIRINLLGEENMHYAQLACALAKDMELVSALSPEYSFTLSLQAGRFSLIEHHNARIIDSSYNAAPASMKQVLQNAFQVQQQLFPQARTILILGDMRELGELTEASHKELVKIVQKAEVIYTVGPYMYEYFIPALQNSGYTGEYHSSLSSRDIGKRVKKHLADNKEKEFFIVVKGSQNTIFTEEAIKEIVGKRKSSGLVRQSSDWISKKEQFFCSI